MAHIVGKGLTYFEIFKFMIYAGVNVVGWVLPLTILLASIMAFGQFGEKYELAAMKAAGISLFRIMRPLFIIVSILSVVLFFFQNNINPYSQKKARNMLINIRMARPALNFIEGQFVVGQIPGFSVKFDKISGEKNEHIEGVFIHKSSVVDNPETGLYEPQYITDQNHQTITAKKGLFAEAENSNYLKFILYNGSVVEDDLTSNKNHQKNREIKFDTMVYYFDITEIREKAIEKETETNNYKFNSYLEIEKNIEENQSQNIQSVERISSGLLGNTEPNLNEINPKNQMKGKILYQMDTIKKDKKKEIYRNAYDKLEFLKNELDSQKFQIEDMVKETNKMILFQQRIVAFSITCILFFIIGTSLGSIIRKGGMGVPVIISIAIFLIFHTMNITMENLTWKGQLDPYWAAWIPNMIWFPFSIWVLYKAVTDSQVFDVEKYKAFFKPLVQRFVKNKEHSRYR